MAASARAEGPQRHSLAEATWAKALVAGPDGNVWFLAETLASNRIILGKVTTAGEVTEMPLSVPAPPILRYQRTETITAGPDGSLWFGEEKAVGRSTTSGEVTSFALPASASAPTAMAAGPDGNIWFTEGAASKIGRITPSGQLTQFALPLGRKPSGIAAGADGNLWFTERAINKIGRITPEGQITEFPLPGAPAKLDSIAAGPDGNLWFGEAGASRVGRITPGGEVAQFAVPTPGGTASIVSGPGGLLYFTSGPEIGAISPAGEISWPSCPYWRCTASPEALALGPDGHLWTASGPERCAGLCGGGTAIYLSHLPGTVLPYVLPPLQLAIGPRLSPLHGNRTSISLACGLETGCSGTVRLGWYIVRHHRSRFQTLSRERYDLHQGESRRISLKFSGKTAAYLRRYKGTHLLVLAGGGQGPSAKRGLYLRSAQPW